MVTLSIFAVQCQRLGGCVLFLWFLWALWALGKGGMCMILSFHLVMHILCQQLGGICIILSLHWYYICHANNWGGLYYLFGVFGPFGPWVEGMCIISCFHWYCIFHANNQVGLYYLFGDFGPFGPWVGGKMYNFKFTLLLYILCQQLGGFVLFVW